jgi:hypothetical protein
MAQKIILREVMRMPKILDRFMGGSAPSLEPRTKIPVFALTEYGKNKLHTEETNSIYYRILDAISAKGTANMQEISDITTLDKGVVRHHLIELIAQNYVVRTDVVR